MTRHQDLQRRVKRVLTAAAVLAGLMGIFVVFGIALVLRALWRWA